ncbi:hypothetical protein GGR57DRAFT_510816 [Xylariaceae sp. FL1272]|nr:hypothetical protein GGR57DRAFT_510816 [Xylariaceae sp. FL1272]
MMGDVAIIGFSFLLPGGAENEETLWDVLENKTSLMTQWPKERVNIDAFYDPSGSRANTLSSRGGHFINDDLSAFDAPFFSIQAKEAASMDPQHRLSLETTYRAFENAGLPVESLKGSRTAVFAASMSDDYARMHAKDPDTAPQMVIVGTPPSLLANRISYHFNLTGPSVHIDTACSSSTIALDLACQSLHSGDATLAVVSGANLLLGPEDSVLMSSLGFLSKDSVCYSFDHRATGYGRGEGVISVILKPIDAAIRDGDIIRAVIRGTGSNQDGRTPVLPQPNATSQEALIRHVYRKAGLGLDMTRYFEAHGTGTGVGDPIEMRAIGEAFRGIRPPNEPLYVGSIKPNLGHLEAASGLAALLKTVLILEKGVITPNALLEKVNPEIPLEQYNIKVPTECLVWPVAGPRRASVSSFGFGGSNCHIVVDDAFHYLYARGLKGNHKTTELAPTRPQSTFLNGVGEHLASPLTNGATNLIQQPKETHKYVNGEVSSMPQLLIWSAATESSLTKWMPQWEEYLQNSITDQEKLNQVAFTLDQRRSRMPWRTYAVIDPESSIQDQAAQLTTKRPTRASGPSPIIFVFTGQGAQYVNMGIELLRFPLYKSVLERIESIFHELGCEWSLFDELRSKSNIDKPDYSQPLCTALQLGLVELLKSFDIVPTVVLGHSSGEIAAAYAAGALSLYSACLVSAQRGKLVASIGTSEKGSMLAVNLSQSEFEEHLTRLKLEIGPQEVHVACVNSPGNITLAGPERTIDELSTYFESKEVFSRKLRTGVAYHSPAMDPISSLYEASLGQAQLGVSQASTIPMISSVTGKEVSNAKLASPEYWAKNLRSRVEFSVALSEAIGLISTVTGNSERIPPDIVEVGPTSALRRPVTETLNQMRDQKSLPAFNYSSVLARNESPIRTLFQLVGRLFCNGHDISIPLECFKDASALQRSPLLLTDCPKYPFDHSRKYWEESRLSRDYRLRTASSSKLLGNHFYDWNPLQPRWRNIASLDVLPWLRDHEISGTKVYPATAMLTMAIQAVKETISAERQVSGYYIKDAKFISPIVVSEEPGNRTETMLHLRPSRLPFEKETKWFEIQIFSYLSERWSEAFSAIIQVQFTESVDDIDNGSEALLRSRKMLQQYEASVESCDIAIDHEKFYDYCHQHGHNYGESFSLLKDIHWDGDEVTIGRIDPPRETDQPTTDTVHPAVLDAALHIFLVQSSIGLSTNTPTFVPSRVTDAWMAASGWQHTETSNIRLSMQTHYKPNGGGLEGAAYALDDKGRLLWMLPTVELFPVSTNNEPQANEGGNLLYQLDYKPHMSLLNPQKLVEFFNTNRPFRDESAMSHYFRRLTTLIKLVLIRTLHGMSEADHKNTPAFLTRYVSWMKQVTEPELELANGCLADSQDDAKIESLLQEVEELHPPWQMFPTIARNLPGILNGKVDPLELVFSTGLAESIYEEQFDGICDERLARLLSLMSHENPNLRILEVGAGTGRLTGHILSFLHEEEEKTGSTKFAEYLYTDISPAFFERASEKFTDDRIKFKTLDLETDLVNQGISPEQYDLVIAGSVLHATRNLSTTLANIQGALKKPSGKLLFLEMVAPEKLITNFGFGVFPGWWLCEEDWRSSGPAINEQSWDQLLRDNGYSGADVCFRDYEGDAPHLISILMTSATGLKHSLTNGVAQKTALFVIDEQTTQHCQIIDEIKRYTSSKSPWDAQILSIDDMVKRGEPAQSEVVVFLVETEKALLPNLSDDKFEKLREIMGKVHNLLWVTLTSLKSPTYPDFSLATGFLRSMRLQTFKTKIVQLAIETDGETMSLSESMQSIFQVLDTSFLGSSTELEFVQRQGLIHSARLVENKALSAAATSVHHPQLRSGPWQPGPALKLSMKSPGLLDSFQFVDDEAFHRSPLGPHEVEFEAKAWGLSFRDLFIALGRLEETEFGYDCAGVVTRVGSACGTMFRPGDRVYAGVLDCMRTFPRAHVDLLGKIPDGGSLEAYASILSPGVTAYYALVTVARLQRGEKILIHSASGGTGQMAIGIAKMLGAEIFATVSNKDKKQLLMEQFGMKEDHIFYSRNTSFSQGIMRVTKGAGMDVILNSLAGDGLRASWECMAPYGRFIEIGKADIMADTTLSMRGFKKNVSFAAVDVFHLATSRPQLAAELITKVIDLFHSKTINHPTPLHLYPVTKIEDAFRYFQSGKNTGRIVLTVDRDDVVQKLCTEVNAWTFDPNASYVVAGGLGGLGRAVLSWMASQGARHLIVPSRSGSSSAAAAEVMAQLHHVNIVAPKCDVGDFDAVSAMLKGCAEKMPPIKGCINAAMVLQDAVFQNMTPAQWQLTIRSKVKTSWNLHRLLPQNLDFFILFSSLSGVYGTVAQTNYSAGCTFQDALARYRVAQGQKAVSFDIGWMRNIGIISEREDYQRRRENEANMAQVEDKELLALLEIYCDPACSFVTSEDRAQVLLGAVTPAMLRSGGHEVPVSVERPLLSGFSQLRGSEADKDAQQVDTIDPGTQFRNATSPAEQMDIVVNALKAKIARALFTSLDDIEASKTLPDYGVDSLLAVELRNSIWKEFQANVAVFDIMGGATIRRVGELVVERSEVTGIEEK